ncbi:hypothetical protein GCM10010353_01370 [Streptomyces chryseus]|uniref:Uncharacterized protein n=1 Tax=Streptomyces chryseus TaxID=68186 RepID=A0ABQ3DIN6_9ACTN|nr:hypothetical protein GCM10010353_01370 [Streptomyces chryseus]GHA90957.1 hypothetical protein GCM10010346_12120 [Streptomyces chryseus]
MLVEPRLYAALDGDQPVPQLRVRRRPYDSDAEHLQGTARDALDDADAAPGQPRVHAQYAHDALPFDHLFVQAIGYQ